MPTFAVSKDIKKARRMVSKTRLHNDKRRANRAFRRTARYLIRTGQELNDKYRLTGWDVS